MTKLLKDYLNKNEIVGKTFGVGNLIEKDNYLIYKVLKIYKKENKEII